VRKTSLIFFNVFFLFLVSGQMKAQSVQADSAAGQAFQGVIQKPRSLPLGSESSNETGMGRFIVPLASSVQPDASQPATITGNYSGTLSQPANSLGYTVWQDQFALVEDSSGNISGTRYSGVLGTPYFVIWSISGKVSNGVFAFSDQIILSQNNGPNSSWCLITGTLIVSPSGNTLSGPWQSSNCGSAGSGTINVSRSSGKLIGSGSLSTGDCMCGDPIDINTGNVHEQYTDYSTSGTNPLQFIRYYNSRTQGTYSTELGTNWRSNFDRYLQLSLSTVVAERANGQQLTFTLQSGKWVSDTDVDVTLSESGSTWTLTDIDDTVETYNAISSIEAVLTSVESRNGYKQVLAYNGASLLTGVTDSYGRSLSFAYNSSNILQTVTTQDSTTITYGYASTTSGSNLISVTNPDNTSVSYKYNFAQLPNVLTGITDEDGNSYALWTYDVYERGLTSQHGSGADLITVAYDDSTGNRTVTNALGVVDTYTFTTLQGAPKVTGISRASTSSTAAATETFTYDSNGYLASKTDWNGNQATYVNNTHGLPTTIDEAVGAGAARTTMITYDSTWVHLPATVTTPGLTTSFKYDSYGELLTKTLTDTTTSSVPYSTAGQNRTWTNTWSNALLASIKSPNGNTSKYGYDSSGALTSTTDAKGFVTNITSHTGGGLPLTIVDPNGVTTKLTYSPRLWLTSSTVSGSSGTYKTTWAHDATGNLTQTTLPDNSYIANTFDTAHRLTKVTDALGNYTSYTLDALGNRTQTNIYPKGGTSASWQRTDTFDALGRLLVDSQGAGQTTTKTYDPNGNVLTVADGLGHTTTNTYDALNRLATSTDANSGITTPGYDAHDRIISVKDANGNATVYIRDGFGDVIQQTSPDSGVSVFQYDADANVTKKTDALGIVTIQTFDALDRVLTTTYPASTAENVAYAYDQTGTGFSFGIGRLTSVTDAAGSLTRAYEERGNLLTETRIDGSKTLITGYTYDGANRVASLTYPDGTVANYQYDVAGYVSTVTAKPAGATSTTTIATIHHQPFGPMNAVTFGNNIAETWSYDNSYRATNLTDTLSSANVQKLTYAYDSANNVKSITDAVNAANSQTLTYDPINRLIGAASGSGGYGTFSWTYDKVGNRLTQVQGSTTTTYTYTAGSNRLAAYTVTKATAMLEQAPSFKPVIGHGPALWAHAPPRGPIRHYSTNQPGTKNSSSTMLATVLGWPMLLVGLTGVVRFRKHLRDNKFFAALFLVAILTGVGTLLNGCGGGSGGGSSSPPPPSQAATPTFLPGAGTYTSAQTVTISDATAGATIYYTTDGSTPSTSSTKYTTAITVSSNQTIQAIASASGYTNSSVASAVYTINLAAAAAPTFSPGTGTYTSVQSVTISDTTPGATIYYTTDGSTPTTSATKYTASISVTATETIKAIAAASGYTNSAVVTAVYTMNIPLVVTVSTNANGNITSIPPANASANASFTYKDANRPASVAGSPLAATFVYDWSGQRVSKTNPGSVGPILYSYVQGGTLIAENDNGTLTDYIYVDGRPIAVLHPSATPTANQVNYILADRMGTPQLASNSSGTTVWGTTYQPFGMTGNVTASITQNLRMPGQYYDVETGFAYNVNRDYMPNVGRYLQSDLIGINGGINPYAYGAESPLVYRDPKGLYAGADDLTMTLGGAAVGMLGQGIADLFTGKLSSWQTYMGAAAGGAAGGEAFLYGGPILSGIAAGAVGNLTTQWVNNETGQQCGINWGSFLGQTTLSGLLGMIHVPVEGITVGQGSWSSVADQITTKLANGTITDFSTETAFKMIGSTIPDAIVQDIVAPLFIPNEAK
jgi:RHS repeat-associated protein